MPSYPISHLAVRVRLLPDPCLWCWEIRDEIEGELVESSWASAWTAYSSREAAQAAGQRRLIELAAGGAFGERAS